MRLLVLADDDWDAVSVTLVEQVRSEVTYPLRAKVLRPGSAAAEAAFAGDGDPGSGHFAAYVDHQVVGVASILAEPEPGGPGVWRLRGMAVEEAHRGSGVGVALLARVRDFVGRCGGGLIWCNARLAALGFYTSAGFVSVGEAWEEPGIGPHVRMHAGPPTGGAA